MSLVWRFFFPDTLGGVVVVITSNTATLCVWPYNKPSGAGFIIGCATPQPVNQ